MSYSIVDSSVHDGEIVELYEFTMGSQAWRMTSSVLSYELAGHEYLPYPLDRGQVERAGEINRTAITIQMNTLNPVAQLFIVATPESQLSVRIFQGHRQDGDFVLVFSGRVISCKWGKGQDAQLSCEPIVTALKRKALRRNYSLSCPYVVYSLPCGANRIYVAGIITAISGLSVSVDSGSTITDGRLIGGTISSGNAIRTITGHVGDALTLIAPMENAEVGDVVSLSMGCDKSIVACDAWHNNKLNFGGEPYISGKNPFSGRMT